MQRLRQFQAHEAKQARTQQLKETEVYKRENEGAEASGKSVMMFVASGPALWAVGNEVHTRRVQEATELWDKAQQRQLIWAYLMAPIYATEDRQQFFDLLAEMVFGHSLVKLTSFVRIYDNDGTSKLCLSSVRTLRLGPHTHGMICKTEGKEGGGKREEGSGERSPEDFHSTAATCFMWPIHAYWPFCQRPLTCSVFPILRLNPSCSRPSLEALDDADGPGQGDEQARAHESG
jgi:hypothetical protein